MEASVETVNKRMEVTGSVFGEIECMISAPQAGFEVAQNRIDPVEFWQILRLATVRRLPGAGSQRQQPRQNNPIYRK